MLYYKEAKSSSAAASDEMNDVVHSPRPRYSIQGDPGYKSFNERRRALFAELLGEGYHHNQIVLNVATRSGAVDLVLYEDEKRQRVHCAVDFEKMQNEPLSPVELLSDIVRKARALDARYAAYISPSKRIYIDVELWHEDTPGQGMIGDVPRP